jgi:hypothetical protein
MDPIRDLFLAAQVASVVHAKLEATAPWGLKREANAAEGIAKDPAQPAISPHSLPTSEWSAAASAGSA